MNKKFTILLGICLHLFSSNVWSQFTKINIPYKVDFSGINANSVYQYLGGTTALYKSSNGGLTWDSTYAVDDQFKKYLQVNEMASLVIDASGTGYMCGLSYIGNTAAVFKTVNNGATWTNVYADNFDTWPRICNDVKVDKNGVIYMCGEYGRLFKSSDGGKSWISYNSGVSASLKQIALADASTGFVAAQNYILKFNTAFAQASYIYFSGKNMNSVSFPSATVGYVAADDMLYKTVNGGTSWVPLTVNFADLGPFLKTEFTSVDTGYVLSKNYVFKTTNGGSSWEKMQFKNSTLTNLHFSSASKGFLCGKAGALYKTNNGGGVFYPISKFTVNNVKLCNDSLINLSNNSYPGYTYTWRLNGKVFSNAFNTQLKIAIQIKPIP
jgi:photosystem II stability/assembly factor-like uncharacterized protein